MLQFIIYLQEQATQVLREMSEKVLKSMPLSLNLCPCTLAEARWVNLSLVPDDVRTRLSPPLQPVQLGPHHILSSLPFVFCLELSLSLRTKERQLLLSSKCLELVSHVLITTYDVIKHG